MLDYDMLAEEVGDMGRRDAGECASRVRTILEHLMKLAATGQDASRSGWRNTIRVQRYDLARALTRTLRTLLETDLDALHEEARTLAADSLAILEPDAPPLDPSRRWTLAQVLGEADDPLA